MQSKYSSLNSHRLVSTRAHCIRPSLAGRVLPLLGDLVDRVIAIERAGGVFRVGRGGGLDVRGIGVLGIFAHGRPA